MNRGKKIVLLSVMAVVGLSASAKDRVVVVPAHPDDLIPCFGTCLLSKDVPRDSCHSSSRFRGRARPSSRKCRRRGDEAVSVSRVQGHKVSLKRISRGP